GEGADGGARHSRPAVGCTTSVWHGDRGLASPRIAPHGRHPLLAWPRFEAMTDPGSRLTMRRQASPPFALGSDAELAVTARSEEMPDPLPCRAVEQISPCDNPA